MIVTAIMLILEMMNNVALDVLVGFILLESQRRALWSQHKSNAAVTFTDRRTGIEERLFARIFAALRSIADTR
jgi:hypothetical protein